MATSFFFYDLETSGFDPKSARIMQFAGQRTDSDLQPVGEPINCLIRLTPDVLPDPDAVLITGIAPQATLVDGLTEAEFLRLFYDDIAISDTIFLGYNSIRFDDEFMRYLHYRNFYDPYRWHWHEGRSRWDMLDVIRLTRALRPDGIVWPFDSSGAPSNRLELLTSVNSIDHDGAHDALVDVRATIAMARLVKTKQPRLFDYLLNMRHKQSVAQFIQSGQPFVYTSGKYPSQFLKTTVVASVAPHPKQQAILVYDLRHEPTEFLALSHHELAERWRWQKEPTSPRLPVKLLQFNRSPAIAPLSVLDGDAQARLSLDLKLINRHLAQLQAATDWSTKLQQAFELMNREQQTGLFAHEQEVDAQLYDNFFDTHDSDLLPAIRAASPHELTDFIPQLHDQRLKALLPLYKARNFPASLTLEEREAWDAFCHQRLLSGNENSRLARYLNRLEALALRGDASQSFLIEELRLYAESIISVESL